MQSNDNCIDDARRASRVGRAAFSTLSVSPTSETQQALDYGALLLAIAGHDLRQPLQALQSAHELLSLGIRTKSELRLLRSGQHAIDRLTAQLDQLLAALRLRNPEGVKPTPLHLMHLLQQVAHENEFETLKKGIRFNVVPSSASIQRDSTKSGSQRDKIHGCGRSRPHRMSSRGRHRADRNLRHRYRHFDRRDAS